MQQSHEAQEAPFDLSGGRLCLDFANTVADRTSPHPVDRLGNVEDLIAFGRQTGILTAEEAQSLKQAAPSQRNAADKALAEALRLGEALFRIFQALVHGIAPDAADLDALNVALPQALQGMELQPAAEGFRWGWRHGAGPVERVLGPVLKDAAELLTSEDRSSLRECAAETCAWLFLDRSKNRSRRWCDMKICGNRSKARRHYQRRRSR